MGDRRTSRYIPCFFLSWLLNVVQLASVQHQRQAQVTDEESEDHLCIRSCTSRVGASSSSSSPWHRSKRWRSHGFVFRRLFLRANRVGSMVCIVSFFYIMFPYLIFFKKDQVLIFIELFFTYIHTWNEHLSVLSSWLVHQLYTFTKLYFCCLVNCFYLGQALLSKLMT